MQSTSKNINTNSHQFEILVEFFQEHSDLAKGQLKTATAKTCANTLWNRLVSDLNAAGPPLRDVAGWKKVLADYKNHLKAKLRRNKSAISDTGGGPSRYCPISPLEEQVTQLLSMDEAVSGISAAMEFGIGQGSSSHPSASQYVTQSEEDDVRPVSSASPDNTTPHSRKRGRSSSTTRGKENLLHKQVENQIKYQENSVKVLKDIRDNLRSLSKNSKKNFELEEKKYKLKLEKFDYKKKNEIEKRKVKLMKLEIKKEMLEVETRRK